MSTKKDMLRKNQVYMQINGESSHMKSIYDESSWQFWRKKRYIVSILAFFGCFNIFSLRSNLSIAIVDMTQLKNVTLENGTISQIREFEWDSRAQGYVLSSFFYGYIVTQILGGYLATRFGGSKIFGAGIASTAFFTLITPWVANANKNNVYYLVALRTAEGFFEGINFSSLLNVWAHWAPPLEKARLTTISVSGGYIGNVISMPLCSLLATSFGWETIFYVTGGFGLFWWIIWAIFVKDSPSKDPWISHQERTYITESINSAKSDEVSIVPWFAILTSGRVWALSLILSCETWGFHTLITFLPQMMKSTLNFDLNKTGFLTALPYIAMSISIQFGGQLSDWLLAKKYMSVTAVRRMVIFVGFFGQATFLLAAALWISPVKTPLFIVLGATFGGVALAGIMVNPLDISPKYASVIYGVNNTFGTIPGIVSPILTGYIVRDLSNVDQWRIVFYISASLYLLGAVTSIIFVTGKIQPWAVIDNLDNIKKTNTKLELENDEIL